MDEDIQGTDASILMDAALEMECSFCKGRSLSPYGMKCPECHGTGIVPTAIGEKVLALIGHHFRELMASNE